MRWRKSNAKREDNGEQAHGGLLAAPDAEHLALDLESVGRARVGGAPADGMSTLQPTAQAQSPQPDRAPFSYSSCRSLREDVGEVYYHQKLDGSWHVLQWAWYSR